jgi:predicted nucleic acid-binding protein
VSRLYVLDSGIYIRAFRDSAFGAELREFHAHNLPRLVLSAVVASELLVGAQRPERERAVLRGLIEPFRSRRRLITPGWNSWAAVAGLDRRLRRRPGNRARLETRSFLHAMLIAASAGEIGATVVTENVADFTLIARHIDVAFVQPFPPTSMSRT